MIHFCFSSNKKLAHYNRKGNLKKQSKAFIYCFSHKLNYFLGHILRKYILIRINMRFRQRNSYIFIISINSCAHAKLYLSSLQSVSPAACLSIRLSV